ncbi:MAG: glycosyltransferase family 2 protein [Clostridiales bacterium]|nr:glycosyltransferase family 2 protein [Clostridiales bacterium]
MAVLYGWTFYNLPIVATGLRRAKKKAKVFHEEAHRGSLPFVSVIVPAKNEGSVIGRCLESLMKTDYPKNKFEVVVVEDGSIDDTVLICEEFEKNYPSLVRVIKNPVSNGKPSALNYALNFVKGEVVGVFDADNVPASDCLVKAVKHFDEESVGAVQGRQCCLNKEENMLTKFVSYENALWYESYLRGKDALGLFVAITGSCYFVRKDVLLEVGGWDGSSLSEDMELAANLTNHGYKVRYAHEVCSWQENPASVKGFFNQRVRWFRGCMEVAVQYGKLMKKPSWMKLDAEVTLMGSFIIASGLMGYFLALISSFVPLALDSVFATAVSSFLITATLVLVGVGMICVSKPHNFKSILWVPFIYLYWMLQTFIAAYALFQLVFRRPRNWIRTTKTGKQTEMVLA